MLCGSLGLADHEDESFAALGSAILHFHQVSAMPNEHLLVLVNYEGQHVFSTVVGAPDKPGCL